MSLADGLVRLSGDADHDAAADLVTEFAQVQQQGHPVGQLAREVTGGCGGTGPSSEVSKRSR